MARVRAPEVFGRGGWIGAIDTFGIAALAGKVVVLDFFTASCVNCVRVQRELREIEDRFPTEVVIVGVYSPKFPREHDHASVELAVERLDIRHPVLDDPDMTTWQQYGVKGWPTLVVIDPEGYVVGGISGEGSGPVVATTIEQVIADHDARGTLTRQAIAGMWVPAGSAGFRSLRFPAGVATDPTGRRIAIADTGNDRVLVADLAGRVEQVYPLLNGPRSVRFDGDRLIVCDTGADRIVAIDRTSAQQTVLATGLASPSDAIVDQDGSILVAEAGRHRLQRIPAMGGDPCVVAGTGEENLVDHPSTEPGATAALLAQPSGLAGLPGGGAVFVDAESSALRVLGPDGSVVTLVGQGLFDWGASDGGPDSSAMQHPTGVAIRAHGDGLPSIYVADALNSLIRLWEGTRWSAASGSLRTLPAAGLNEPQGLAVLPDGRLVVADTNAHRVVIIDPVSADPIPLTLDESWLGTVVEEPLVAASGDSVDVPFEFDTGTLHLDPAAGAALRVEVSAEPATLLAAGPRAWAFAETTGEVRLTAGSQGEGIVVVSIEASVCDETQCTVLRARRRQDLTVTPRRT